MPNSSGFGHPGQAHRDQRRAFAGGSATRAVRSMSVSASPLMTRNGSSRSASSAFLTLPAVPSGSSSVAYCRLHPELLAVAEVVADQRGEELDRDDDVGRARAGCSRRRTCSMIGRFTTGSSGLGMFEVIGRRRVPSPPAITTAFMPVPARRRARPPGRRRTMPAHLDAGRASRPTSTARCPRPRRPSRRPWRRRPPLRSRSPSSSEREGEQQVERGRLAQVVDRQRAEAVPTQNRQRERQHHVTTEQQDDQPPGHDVAQAEAEQGGDDVEPVGERVEQLSEPGDLVPVRRAITPSR